MLDMEYIESDYSVLLDDPEPENGEGSNLPQEPLDQAEPSNRESDEAPASWWSLQYYQRFFDMTTEEVFDRVSASMIPLQSEGFLWNDIQEKPDLYGPFWICATLALETGVSSQAAYYYHQYGLRSWRQTVRTVYQAAVLLFLYCWCLPTFLWIALEWNPLATHKFRLPELWCIFGYATAVLLPAAAFWALPVVWLRWVTVNIAVVTSGIFVCRYLKKAFAQIHRQAYYTVLGLFFVLHCLVGYSFVFLFFPSKSMVAITSSQPFLPNVLIFNQTIDNTDVNSNSSLNNSQTVYWAVQHVI